MTGSQLTTLDLRSGALRASLFSNYLSSNVEPDADTAKHNRIRDKKRSKLDSEGRPVVEKPKTDGETSPRVDRQG